MLGINALSGGSANANWLVFDETFDGDLSAWSDDTRTIVRVLENCIGTGTAAITSSYAYASAYGAGATWHGPRKKRSFSAIGDFRLTVDPYINEQATPLGLLQVELWDGGSNYINVSMNDGTSGTGAGSPFISRESSSVAYAGIYSGPSGLNLEERQWVIERIGSNLRIVVGGTQYYNTTDASAAFTDMYFSVMGYGAISTYTGANLHINRITLERL